MIRWYWSFEMADDQRPKTNRYSGITRSSRAALSAPAYPTEPEAKGKMIDAPAENEKPAKPLSRKRKENDSTPAQPSSLSMQRPSKPEAPSKPTRPKTPGGVNAAPQHGGYGPLDATLPGNPPSKKRKTKSDNVTKPEDGEKRLRVFRKKAPLSYLEKLERATSQRMFVIDRTRGGTEAVPEETIDMAGTTGNIYSITISQMPKCTCPDNKKGNQCKHIVYVC
jgi:hypothetical protein